MVHFIISVLLICAIVVDSSQISRISAQPGENVTVWCQHPSQIGKNIHWFKQTNGAVPVSIVYMMITYQLEELRRTYLNGFPEERFVMTLKLKNTSLNIVNVDVSDSGLYYCGWVDWVMTFGDGTHLDIKVKDVSENRVTPLKTETYVTIKDLKSPSVSTKHCPGNIFYKLTFVFGGCIFVFVFIFLILVIIRIRKKQDEDADQHATQHHEDPPSAVYAALRFSTQKSRRADRQAEDTVVVYSATR